MTTDELAASIRETQWHLDVRIPGALKGETHARRVASLRRQRTEYSATLSRLVTELGAEIQNRNR